jgi:long-subunit fatty acid transport protein
MSLSLHAPSRSRPRAGATLAPLFALSLGLTLARPAAAAGFYFADLGPRQLGRGATGVAGPGDLSALVYNAAGLASLPDDSHLFIQLGASLTEQPISFQRGGGCGAALSQCPTVPDTAGWYPNTLSGAAFDLGLITPVLSGLVLGVGFHGPSALGVHRFPDPRGSASTSDVAVDAPQRYSLISSDDLLLYPALALAYRLTDWLDLGAGIDFRYFHITQTQSIFGVGDLGGDIPDFDAIATFDARQVVAPVFNGGVIVHLPQLPGLSLGLSGRLSAGVSADGTLSIAVPALASALNLSVLGNRAHVDLRLPSEARLGAQYQGALGLLAADLGWEGWGVLHTITVTPEDISIVTGAGANQTTTKVAPIVLLKNFHGAFSGRFGGEFNLPKLLPGTSLVLRAGAIYETSAIPDQSLQVDFVDGPRLAGTLGFSVRRGELELTLGYAHYFQSVRDVTESSAVRVNPFPGGPQFVIGNGVYTTSLDSLGLQLTWGGLRAR